LGLGGGKSSIECHSSSLTAACTHVCYVQVSAFNHSEDIEDPSHTALGGGVNFPPADKMLDIVYLHTKFGVRSFLTFKSFYKGGPKF